VLNREQILGAKDRPQLILTVEEWGGDVMLTALSVSDRATILGEWARIGTLHKDTLSAADALLKTQLMLVALSITDESGAPLFTVEDITELARKSGDAIGKIADAAVTLNKFAVSATEDVAKN
jgi:hypothetical protein